MGDMAFQAYGLLVRAHLICKKDHFRGNAALLDLCILKKLSHFILQLFPVFTENLRGTLLHLFYFFVHAV